LKSCVPAPVCQNQDFKLTSVDDIKDIGSYLGDTSKTNWVTSGKTVPYNNEALLLTMAPDTVGTLMSSTHYMWYGKVAATLTTSKGAGVVTAFILMSDSKDEIDYEFVGVDLQTAQTNYYAQGIPNCTEFSQLANFLDRVC
jgi:beta-glucanase (GH16 family)